MDVSSFESNHGTERLLPPRAWIPSVVTAANIVAGFMATLLASEGHYESAVHVLLLAIFLDMFDGRLARMLKATSDFGQQLDSFSDAMSFGAAPAFLVYQATLYQLNDGVGLLAALSFVLAGVYRLARFNLLTDAHSKARRTLGVPIPIAAGYVMAVVLMRDHLTPAWSAVIVILCSLLMVSRWRLPDLKGKGLVSAALLVGICNYLAVMFWPNWTTVIWWNLWNAVILLAARAEDRRLALETASV